MGQGDNTQNSNNTEPIEALSSAGDTERHNIGLTMEQKGFIIQHVLKCLKILFLHEIFGKRLLALKSIEGNDWAPHSCDVNPCDYWLWSNLKREVYKPMPIDIEDLKQKVTVACNQTEEPLVKKVILAMKERSLKISD